MLPEDRELEREAYDFATEFLAPRQESASHLRCVSMQRLAALKTHWGISMAALLKRAEGRGYVSPWQARQFWIRLKSYGQDEPVATPNETPALLQTIVAHHTKQLGHSVVDLSAHLHQRPDEFRADFGLDPTRLRVVL